MPTLSHPQVGEPSSSPPLRPWILLVGIGLFLAGGIVGAIVVLSLTLYHQPSNTADDAVALLTPTMKPTQTMPPPQPTPTTLPTPTRPTVGTHAGQRAPDFQLPDLEGTIYQLSSFRGQIVLINFWATWCHPCQREWPELNAFARQFEQVTVLAINVKEPRRIVQDFTQEENSPLHVLMDYDGTISDQYRISSFPTTFVLDTKGFIHKVVPGGMTAAEMKALITFENDP